jgi:tetratricopeptide (TPR) repeat protein
VKKTLAQRHWSDFEQLAFELTKDCFGIAPTKLLRTQESKDGGFDAVFIHELGKLKEIMVSHETLMEAKLRTEKTSVGLRAFAATMIIAFNGHTNCLVIVSNREFSPQALEAARNFQWKSRLCVILVSQKTLSAWIRPRFKELVKRYPREMLDDIVLANPEDEQYQEIEIPGSNINGIEPPARIASGLLPNGEIARCEIVITQPSPAVELDRMIIGQARRRVVRGLIDALSAETGCVVVKGEPGVGKSLVIQAVLQALPENRRCLSIIDLAQIATSRQMFLTIVAQLLGLEIAEAARQFTSATAKQVFSTAGGVKIPESVTDAVLSILFSSFPNVSDVDQIHLAEYLSFVADNASAGGRLIVFHNLDKTTGEVLEFLHSIVPKLTEKNVSVLFELSIRNNTQLIGASKWNAYVDLFELAATLGCFSVPNLDQNEAVELLLEQLPGLGHERARFISERVGNRPLFLHHAALWLKQRNVVAERAQGAHLIEKPEIFFEGLRPETSISILDRHIDIWRRETTLPFADIITAATLLNGRLPAAVIQLLIPNGTAVEAVLDSLIDTGLFVSEPGLNGVRISHSLLLERMTEIENGKVPGYGERKFTRKGIACKLLDAITSFTEDGAIRDFYRSSFLAACERWAEAWESAKSAAKAFIRENQLAIAAEAFLRCIQASEHLISDGDSRGNLWRIHSLIDFLQVENERYRLGLEENLLRLDSLMISLSTTKLPEEDKSSHEIFIRGQYLKWRTAFTREIFDEALSIARNLFNRVCQIEDIDPEVAGRAVASLGITLKAVEQTEESKQIFDLGVSHFPNSAYCQMEQWSNLAALSLRNNPDQSLLHYKRILGELSKSLPLLERIHVEVDMAMAMFLAGQLNDAVSQAFRATNMADTNGIPAQAARGRNIIGCIQWCEGQLSDAIELLDRAILDAERSYMERFLWRFRVNLASATAEAGEINRALANARWAEEQLVKSRSSHWTLIAASEKHVSSRWYVALLAIGLTYYKCKSAEDSGRLLNSLVLLPAFHRHLEDLTQGKFPAEVFDNTTHRQGNYIMITG